MPLTEPDPAARPRLRQMLAAAAIGVAAAVLLLRWTAPDAAPAALDDRTAVTPPPLPPRPEPTPIAPLPPQLSDALDLMAIGRLQEAQRLMLDFSRGPGAEALPPEHQETMTAMLGRLAHDPVLAAAIELEEGFKDADLNRLRRTLGSLARQQMISLRRDPQAARRVDDARRLTAEVDAIEARLASDRLAALRLAQDFRRRHPRFAAGLDFERRAAAAIDETAGRLIAADRLDEARTLLLELKALRGDQAGESPHVEAKLAAIEAVFRRRDDLDATVREIEVLGWKRPHEALQLLAGMERTPENRDRFAQLQSTLTMLMEDLDQNGPEVEIRIPQDPEKAPGVYDRDEDIVLRVRAMDDYDILSVRFFWRWFDKDGTGEIVEAVLRPVTPTPLPVPAGAAGAATAEVEFEVTISVGEHQGRNLQFWAEAADRGGRASRSAEGELAPERRGFLRRLGLRRGL